MKNKNRDMRWLIRRISSILGNIWYWFRCHTYTKYHIINLKKQQGWGWVDRDRVLFNAAFNIFIDFVEKELNGSCKHDYTAHIEESKKNGWSYSEYEEQMRDWDELQHLYEWYTIGRKNTLEIINKLWARGDYSDAHDLEDQLYETDTQKLLILCKHRAYLWT